MFSKSAELVVLITIMLNGSYGQAVGSLLRRIPFETFEILEAWNACFERVAGCWCFAEMYHAELATI